MVSNTSSARENVPMWLTASMNRCTETPTHSHPHTATHMRSMAAEKRHERETHIDWKRRVHQACIRHARGNTELHQHQCSPTCHNTMEARSSVLLCRHHSFACCHRPAIVDCPPSKQVRDDAGVARHATTQHEHAHVAKWSRNTASLDATRCSSRSMSSAAQSSAITSPGTNAPSRPTKCDACADAMRASPASSCWFSNRCSCAFSRTLVLNAVCSWCCRASSAPSSDDNCSRRAWLSPCDQPCHPRVRQPCHGCACVCACCVPRDV